MMHTRYSRRTYSFFALLISALLHASLWGFIVTHKEDKKPDPPKNIAMQMAMFKQVVVPPPVEPTVKPAQPESKPVIAPPVEPIVEKVVTEPVLEPKPIVKTLTKPKPKKKKVKKKVKKKIKKKKIVKKKVVRKKPKKVTKVVTKPKRPVQQVAQRTQRRANRGVPQRTPPRQAPTHRAAPARSVAVVSRTQQQAPRAINPQFENQYQRRVQQKIEQKKSYPRRAKRMRQQGVVKVGFTISKTGIISDLRIVQSSSVKSLDQAALQAVKKVGRFPAFPAGLNKPFIRYVIPIAYRIH